MNSEWLKGVFCAVVTPVYENVRNTLDEDSFQKVIEHVIKGKVNGIVVLGTAGEFPCFNKMERENIIKCAVKLSYGRVPIVIGAGGSDFEAVILDIKMAKQYGAQAALVVPPFYYHINQIEVENYYKTIAQETNFPIIIYNIPGNTKVPVEYSTVVKLSKIPNIIGIKDTTRDLNNLQNLVFNVDRKNNDFKIMLGTDIILLAGFVLGVDGVISISCNLDPSLDIDLWNACKEGNYDKAWHIQDKIIKVFNVIRSGSFPAALKESTKLLGLTSNTPCYPVSPLNNVELETLRNDLRSLGYEL